jgi:hypothetical protein
MALIFFETGDWCSGVFPDAGAEYNQRAAHDAMISYQPNSQ